FCCSNSQGDSLELSVPHRKIRRCRQPVIKEFFTTHISLTQIQLLLNPLFGFFLLLKGESFNLNTAYHFIPYFSPSFYPFFLRHNGFLIKALPVTESKPQVLHKRLQRNAFPGS